MLAQLKGVPRPRGERAAVLPSPGLYTAHTTYLHRDKALLRRLLRVPLGGAPGAGRPGSVCGGGAAACCGSALAPPPGPAEEAAVGRADCIAEATPPGAHAGLHHPSGEAWPAGRRAPGWRGRQQAAAQTQARSLPPQEHYMASLMPLPKSITPWKVWSREGLGGWALCRPSRGCAGAPGASPSPHPQVALTGKRNEGHTDGGGARGPLLWEGSPWDLSLQGGGWGTHKGSVRRVPWGRS